MHPLERTVQTKHMRVRGSAISFKTSILSPGSQLNRQANGLAADRAEVDILLTSGVLRVEIEDMGKGFDPALLEQGGEDWMGALGVGVRGMNERMKQLRGKLEIIKTEHGTLVRATIPSIQARPGNKQ
jgi:signal transduction histidine kinase